MIGFMDANRPPAGHWWGLWLADGKGVQQAAAAVTKWLDEQGNGRAFSPMDTNKFSYVASASPNGKKPVLRTTGVAGYSCPSAPTVASGFHALFVIKSSKANAVNNPGLHAMGTSGQGVNFPYSDDGIYDDFGYSARLNGIAGHGADLRAGCIYEVECSSGGAWIARVNGTQVGTQSGGTKGFAATLQFANIGGGSWSGDIMAFAIDATGPLATAHAAAMRSWLTAKYLT